MFLLPGGSSNSAEVLLPSEPFFSEDHCNGKQLPPALYTLIILYISIIMCPESLAVACLWFLSSTRWHILMPCSLFLSSAIDSVHSKSKKNNYFILNENSRCQRCICEELYYILEGVILFLASSIWKTSQVPHITKGSFNVRNQERQLKTWRSI